MEDVIVSKYESIVDDATFDINAFKFLDPLNYPHMFSYLVPLVAFQSITLSLYVLGQTCETPRATVNLYNTIDSTVYMTDLDLKNWTAGDLMADATVKLNWNDDHYVTIYQAGITLGSIGWNEVCDIWYGSTSYDWVIWSYATPFYSFFDEKCISYSLDTIPAYKDYRHEVDGSFYVQYYLLPRCPFYFYNGENFLCTKCFSEWSKCTGSKPEDCTLCDFPSPFLLGGSCVDECPEDLYDYDYISYEWVPNDYYDSSIVDSTLECQTNSPYSKDNLSVEINLEGTSSTIMISAGGTLVMNINNKRGNITSYKFTQVTPTPDPNDELTNLFPLIDGTTNQYLNETQTVELNSETIENYAEGTLFKVMAEVENDCGDKALDYITFVLNPTPTIGTASITCPSSPWAVMEEVTVTVIGDWYSEDIYEMELYIKISLELPDGTTVLLVPEQWEETVFTFIMPVVSTVNETVAARLLVTAINMHDNTNTLNKPLTIDNTLADGYESSLFSPDIDLTSLKDLTLLSSQMQLILTVPSNLLSNEGRVCCRDSDWSNHGIWANNGLDCQWDDGFAGVDCSMDYQIFSSLSSLVGEAVDYLSDELVTESYIKRTIIQTQFQLLNGLLIRPELFEYEQVLSLIKILEEIAELRDSVLLALPFEFNEIFIQFAEHYYTKLKYELIINMRSYNKTEFLSPAAYSSYSDKLENIKADSQAAWVAIEKYLTRISSRVNIDNTFAKYSSVLGSFKLEYMTASSLNGTTYTLNSEKGYTATLPVDLFDGSTLTDLSQPIRVLSISWYIGPTILSNQDTYKTVSDILSIHLIDSSRNAIQVSGKSISLSMPFSNSGLSNASHLVWKSWSIDTHKSKVSDSNWTVDLSPLSTASFSNCEECGSSSRVSISSSHLSSFAIVEPTDWSIEPTSYSGVGHKRDRKMEELPLPKAHAWILLICLLCVYWVAMLVFLVVDETKV